MLSRKLVTNAGYVARCTFSTEEENHKRDGVTTMKTNVSPKLCIEIAKEIFGNPIFSGITKYLRKVCYQKSHHQVKCFTGTKRVQSLRLHSLIDLFLCCRYSCVSHAEIRMKYIIYAMYCLYCITIVAWNKLGQWHMKLHMQWNTIRLGGLTALF